MQQILDTSYGSDQNGLVWGYQFTPNQPAQPLTSASAIAVLATLDPHQPDQFLWLHFSLSNSACEAWMRQHLSVPESFYESLQGQVGSTRLEQDDNSLVAIIHDVLFDFKFDASAVATTHLCVEPRLLITARLRPLRSVDRLRTAVRKGQSFRSTAELLAHLLREQCDVLVDILRQSTQRVDQIEDNVLAHRISISRSELGALRRVLVRLQRLLAPEPAALFRLLNHPPHWINEEDLQDLRQAAEEFSAAVSDGAVLAERVKLLQEELTALVTEQTNRTLFILTVVTVLALPINLIASLFGMNVGGIPLANHGSGFYVIVGALLILTSLLAYLALLKRPD